MKPEVDEMKKRLIHQVTEDFYSRFESNEEKLERLRKLQMGEIPLPPGMKMEGEIKLPDVDEMHSMFMKGIARRLNKPEITATSMSQSQPFNHKEMKKSDEKEK